VAEGAAVTRSECEHEWLIGDYPGMLADLVVPAQPRVREYTDRKYRLWSCACCRRIWHLLTLANSREAVEYAERYADGLETPELLSELADQLYEARTEYELALLQHTQDKWDSRRYALLAAWEVVLSTYRPDSAISDDRTFDARSLSDAVGHAVYYESLETQSISDNTIPVQTLEDRAMCDLFRDVFGNPFRPPTFSPSWRTETAVSLARTMYEARDFGAMPILADALQDAGCDNEDVLNHCRDPNQVHVRGCWVVDLVLDKG
jgi:hypothetical protein